MAWGEKIEQLAIKEGEAVQVSIDLESNCDTSVKSAVRTCEARWKVERSEPFEKRA